MRLLSRWVLVIAVITACVAVGNFSFAKYVAVTGWEVGKAWAFPRPPMPGPIDGPGPIYGDFSNENTDPLTRVVITFDDGGLTSYDEQFPIMQKYRLQCTHFIVTLRVGDFNFMNWDQIREVRDWGCHIESHTASHPDLRIVSKETLKFELTKSREMIQERLGNIPTVIASPEGKYDARVIKAIEDVGYEAHATGYGGENGKINDGAGYLNPFELIRFDVKNYHSADDICNAVIKAEGRPQLLIFVYHFSLKEDDPAAKGHYKTFKSLGRKIPDHLTVFVDVFDDMMRCIAHERDEGRIRVTSIPEALRFFRALEKTTRAKELEKQEALYKEVLPTPPVPSRAVELPVRRRVQPQQGGARTNEDQRWDSVLTIMKPERSRR